MNKNIDVSGPVFFLEDLQSPATSSRHKNGIIWFHELLFFIALTPDPVKTLLLLYQKWGQLLAPTIFTGSDASSAWTVSPKTFPILRAFSMPGFAHFSVSLFCCHSRKWTGGFCLVLQGKVFQSTYLWSESTYSAQRPQMKGGQGERSGYLCSWT